MLTLFHIGPKGLNIGNEAIRVGMNLLVNQTFGEHVNVVSIPASARFESHARAGLTAEVIHEINQFGDGVIVGGGNLLENGQLTVDPNALAALRVPLFMFSLSWGRIFDRHGRLVRRTDSMSDDMVRSLYDHATLSLARDTATLTHLESLGIEGTILGGCPTLFLRDVATRLPELAEVNRGHTLVSVRSPSLMNVPLTAQQAVASDLIGIVSLLRDGGRDPVLLCHDHRDIAFASSFDGVEYLYIQDVFEYLALLRSAELNVTYRLHSALPCIEFGTSFIKISYDERSWSLMETVGMSPWSINLLTADSVVGAVEERLNEIDRLDLLIRETEPIRDGLRHSMRSAMTKFRDSVGS